MNNSRAAITGENKLYIEGLVHKIGRHDTVVIPFLAYDLGWTTYYPKEGEDVEAFLEDEKERRPESYERKQKWDAQIRQALSGFGQSNNPIGFSS